MHRFHKHSSGALAALLIGALLAARAVAGAPDWTVGEDSRVGFRTTQAGQPVEGIFRNFEASIEFDPAKVETSRVTVTIRIDSVDSGSADRDSAVRSAPLFDSQTWPSARFQADRFEASADGLYVAHGSLTLRDVTKEIELPFKLDLQPDPDDPGRVRAAASGEIVVRRLDYGVGQGLWKDTSMVPNEITIFIDIRATRPAD